MTCPQVWVAPPLSRVFRQTGWVQWRRLDVKHNSSEKLSPTLRQNRAKGWGNPPFGCNLARRAQRDARPTQARTSPLKPKADLSGVPARHPSRQVDITTAGPSTPQIIAFAMICSGRDDRVGGDLNIPTQVEAVARPIRHFAFCEVSQGRLKSESRAEIPSKSMDLKTKPGLGGRPRQWRYLQLKRLGNPVGEVWLINDRPRMRIAFPWWSKPLAAGNDQLGLGVAEGS
jgi:hypothetical protein